MPRTRWQDNLSVDRFTPDELLTADLRRQRLQQQIQQAPLEQQLKEFQLTRSQSQEAKARYDLQKEIETDRQKTAFYNGLQELEAGLRDRGYGIGSKEHAEAFATYAHEFPLARSAADVQQTLKVHAVIADEQAALEARMRELAPAPEKIGERYARVQGQIQGFTDESAKEEAENIKHKLPDVPFTQAPKLHAAQAEAALLEKQYPVLKPTEPAAEITAPAQEAVSAPVTETPALKRFKYNPETGDLE